MTTVAVNGKSKVSNGGQPPQKPLIQPQQPATAIQSRASVQSAAITSESNPILNSAEQNALVNIVTKILQPGKGILAADDTNEQMGIRLAKCGMKNTAENRRRYRQLLFTTPNLSNSISAVILHDDAYHQNTEKGERLVDLLRRQQIVSGIQVDRGLVPLTGSSHNELTTQGLDDLAARAREYKKGGCDFAKFLVTYHIGESTPSQLALAENANLSARYASICQKEGLVPFIEPNVSCDGAHGLEKCQEITELVLTHIYKSMAEHNVLLEGTILKTNMVTPGLKAAKSATPNEIAQATITALRRTVPPAVPGVGFLSGGISDVPATEYLQAINTWHSEEDLPAEKYKPWRLTFCYGRALQGQVMEVWSGHGENVRAAQEIFTLRITANGLASEGKYTNDKDVANTLLTKTVEKIGIYY